MRWGGFQYHHLSPVLVCLLTTAMKTMSCGRFLFPQRISRLGVTITSSRLTLSSVTNTNISRNIRSRLGVHLNTELVPLQSCPVAIQPQPLPQMPAPMYALWPHLGVELITKTLDHYCSLPMLLSRVGHQAQPPGSSHISSRLQQLQMQMVCLCSQHSRVGGCQWAPHHLVRLSHQLASSCLEVRKLLLALQGVHPQPPWKTPWLIRPKGAPHLELRSALAATVAEVAMAAAEITAKAVVAEIWASLGSLASKRR